MVTSHIQGGKAEVAIVAVTVPPLAWPLARLALDRLLVLLLVLVVLLVVVLLVLKVLSLLVQRLLRVLMEPACAHGCTLVLRRMHARGRGVPPSGGQ